MTTIETISSEVWKLIWKWGLWALVLACTVASRLFYEMVHNPEVKFRRLLALAGLSSSVGMLAIIWCGSMGFGKWSLVIIAIATLASYRFVDYLVSLDGDTVKEWVRGVVNNAIDTIGKRENRDGK